MLPKRIPAPKVDPSPLAQPLRFEFSGKVAKNRFLKAAMTEQLSSWDSKILENRGIPSRELINMYRRWGEGGAGLIMTGNIMIAYDQLEAAGNAIIPPNAPFCGERFNAFRDLAIEAKKHGSLLIAQVNHPGRYASDKFQMYPISASGSAFEGGRSTPLYQSRQMERLDFESTIDSFSHAAEFLYRTGFDGMEIHSGLQYSGFLLAEFLSPWMNKRTDEYNGPMYNRSKIIFDISQAIRVRVPDKSFSLSIKLNSTDFQESGFLTEDCNILCARLEEHGFDFIELVGGTFEQTSGFDKVYRESTRKREDFFLEFVNTIISRPNKIKIYVAGGLRTVNGMVKALNTIDGVAIGRPMSHEFDFAQKILDGKINSAIDYLLDEQDFALTNLAAGTQMRLVGNDREPLDLSREDHLKVFTESMQEWHQIVAASKDDSKYGFVIVNGIKLQPFGTVYSEIEAQ